MFQYEYERPQVTVDIVVNVLKRKRYPNGILGNPIQIGVVTIERKNDPYKGMRALPGGFVNPDETTKEAAVRELAEETGLGFKTSDLNLIDVWSEPDRDPRDRTITIAYYAEMQLNDFNLQVEAGDDATNIMVEPVDVFMGNAAFDHSYIVQESFAYEYNERLAEALIGSS